ncbi:MAG TPA: trypsin-like peptidase domain-containing protein [Candidatus Methylomirabilis sp.]|nr:trypsin-like peptidase domain-containing protein [Candidatus Methylomirabilis sp.]
MKSTGQYGKVAIAFIAGASQRGLFIARQRTLRIRALIIALALIPAAPALAAAACNQSIADLYDSKSPAVVLVSALTINPYRLEDRVQLVTGSGFIIDAQGLVMTNSHVVFGAQAVIVTLDDGTELPAKLLGADPIFDLAILQIPKPDHGKLPVLVFGDSDGVRVGDGVVAIGNPLGLDQTITSGIISGLNRILPDRPQMLTRPMIQTDAAINPGNSGGPLLNRCGEVIGVTTEILGDAQNIGFAIPSDLARSVVAPLVEKGRLIRPWFGVDGSLVDARLRKIFTLPLADGFLVEAVEPDSPASVAGIVGGRLPVKVGTRSLILGGDVIVAINGIALKDDDSLQRALDTIHIGARTRLKVFRNGKTFTTELAITERPLQPGDVPESSQSFSVQQNQNKNNDKTH